MVMINKVKLMNEENWVESETRNEEECDKKR